VPRARDFLLTLSKTSRCGAARRLTLDKVFALLARRAAGQPRQPVSPAASSRCSRSRAR
jgi:hypothetical protein